MSNDSIYKHGYEYYNDIGIEDENYKKNLLLIALLWSYSYNKSDFDDIFLGYKEAEISTIKTAYKNKKIRNRAKDKWLRYNRTTSENPRDEHLKLVGTIRKASDSWWDTHLPPSAWNCKCSVSVVANPSNKVVNKGSVPVGRYMHPASNRQLLRITELPYYKELTQKEKNKIKRLFAIFVANEQNNKKEN